jgi:hypothetical protein
MRAARASIAGLLIVASAQAMATPRYIADLRETAGLDAGVVNGSTVRFLAGPRFAAMVPASQQEVCQLLREHYARTLPGVRSVQIVDAANQATVSCR